MKIEIKTERLLLRPFRIEDLAAVHEYASDIENTRYMMYLPNETLDDTQNFLHTAHEEWKKDRPAFYEFAVTLNNRLIGAVSVYLNENRSEGELGWIINKRYWGNGYATEAALYVKKFALNSLKVMKLVAHCDVRNTASSNVMKKIGLSLERDDGIRVYKHTAEVAGELMYSLQPRCQVETLCPIGDSILSKHQNESSGIAKEIKNGKFDLQIRT